jgi:VanZ family protein
MKAKDGSGKVEVEKKDLRDVPDNCSSALRLPPSTFRLFIYYWLPLIAYCLFIFFLSSFSSPFKLPRIALADKIAHVCAYGLLGFLFYRAYRSHWPTASVWTMSGASLLSTGVYGATDEIHQYFVPGRFADPWDLLADVIGALLGVIAYRGWMHFQSRRDSSYSRSN